MPHPRETAIAYILDLARIAMANDGTLTIEPTSIRLTYDPASRDNVKQSLQHAGLLGRLNIDDAVLDFDDAGRMLGELDHFGQTVALEVIEVAR